MIVNWYKYVLRTPVLVCDVWKNNVVDIRSWTYISGVSIVVGSQWFLTNSFPFFTIYIHVYKTLRDLPELIGFFLMVSVTRLCIWLVKPSLFILASNPALMASDMWPTTVVVFKPRSDATSSYKYKIYSQFTFCYRIQLCILDTFLLKNHLSIIHEQKCYW